TGEAPLRISRSFLNEAPRLADVIRLRNACSISRSAQLGLFKRRLRRRQNETIIYIMQLKNVPQCLTNTLFVRWSIAR
ncbi:hypothetical protein, partial [Bifidobacterium bifidum]|uniref:hypothetical protein n=1 Tax=Bifidobacterium bifidum TaxID=1681 RepID=UPI0022E46573